MAEFKPIKAAPPVQKPTVSFQPIEETPPPCVPVASFQPVGVFAPSVDAGEGGGLDCNDLINCPVFIDLNSDVQQLGADLLVLDGRVDTLETDLANLTTTEVPEGTRLYFTELRVLQSLLTGLSISNAGPITASFSVLQALGSLQFQLQNLPPNSVVSVNGLTGVVVLTTTEIAEGVNQYFTEARVRSTLMTGLLPNNAPVVASDSLIAAIGKLQGQISGFTGAVTSVNGLTGVVVLTTTNISEGTNLYFTEARVLNSVLSGFTVGPNTAINAADSVLSAFGKTQGQLNAKLDRPITDGTDGQVLTRSGATPHAAVWATLPPSTDDAIQYTPADTDNNAGTWWGLISSGTLSLKAALNRLATRLPRGAVLLERVRNPGTTTDATTPSPASANRLENILDGLWWRNQLVMRWLGTTANTLIFRNASGIETQGQVPTALIADAAVTTPKIADAAVTRAKIEAMAAGTALIRLFTAGSGEPQAVAMRRGFSGSGTVAAGTATVVVPNLSANYRVQVTPTSSYSGDYWVVKSSGQFTVTCSNASAGFTFDWIAFNI